jgi:UDP-glucose 4-epimerase
MDVLITGGFGNLGSWLVRDALARGHRVSVLARRWRPIFPDGTVEWLECDIGDGASVRAAVGARAFDAVVHCACASNSPAPDYYETAMRVNALGTRHLVEALKAAPPRVLVYFSTMHVHGRNAGEVTEASELAPRGDYAATHLFAEPMVRWLEAKGTRVVTLRLTNSYGCPLDPGTSQWGLLLNDLARMAAVQGEVRLNSNGRAWRDFIWMGDVCEVVARLIEPGCGVAGTYLLGAGRSMTLWEVAERVAAAWRAHAGSEVPVRLNAADMSDPGPKLRVDTGRLQGALGGYAVNDRVEAEAVEVFKLVERMEARP